MSSPILFRRGNTTQRTAIVLNTGEPGYDTTLKQLFVGDGVTNGGIAIAGTGTKWFSGSGAPTGAAGNNSNFYLCTANGAYYQSNNSTWNYQGNLTGPAGGGGANAAANVSYLAPGSNAVTTTVQSVLDREVWVENYLAPGFNPLTDDATSAIAAAVNDIASTGGVVKFARGYLFNYVLDTPNVIFRGVSGLSNSNPAYIPVTHRAYDPTQYCLQIGSGTTLRRGLGCEHMAFDGRGTAQFGVKICGVYNFIWHASSCIGFTTKSLYITSTTVGVPTSELTFSQFCFASPVSGNAEVVTIEYGSEYTTGIFFNNGTISSSAGSVLSLSDVNVDINNAYISVNGANGGIRLLTTGTFIVAHNAHLDASAHASTYSVVYVPTTSTDSAHLLEAYIRGYMNINGLVQFSDAVTIDPFSSNYRIPYRSMISYPLMVGPVSFLVPVPTADDSSADPNAQAQIVTGVASWKFNSPVNIIFTPASGKTFSVNGTATFTTLVVPNQNTATRTGSTPQSGAIIYDTTLNAPYIGDGSTAGGQALRGVNGSIWFTGSGAPTGGGGSNNNNFYLVTGNGAYYQSNTTAWVYKGNLTGPQGTAGANGANGTNGTNGTNGAIWFSGAGAPSGGGGANNGNFYLCTANGSVYGSNSTAWVYQLNITGPAGANGANGSGGGGSAAVTYNTQSGAYTLQASDTSTPTEVDMNLASTNTVTFDASVMANGVPVVIRQTGTAPYTIKGKTDPNTGDLLLIITITNDASAPGLDGQFTNILTDTATSPNNGAVRVSRRVVDGSENKAFTGGGNSDTTVCLRIVGANTSAPIDVSLASKSTTGASSPVTMTASGVTTTAANDLLVYYGSLIASFPTTQTTFDAPSGFTTHAAIGTIQNGNFNLYVGSKLQASAGASGSVAAIGHSDKTAGYFAGLIAVKSAPGKTAYVATVTMNTNEGSSWDVVLPKGTVVKSLLPISKSAGQNSILKVTAPNDYTVYVDSEPLPTDGIRINPNVGIYDADESNSVWTYPIDTQTSGSSFVAFVQSGCTANVAACALNDNKGNTWTLQGYIVGSIGTAVWTCANGVGGAGHSVHVSSIDCPKCYFVECIGVNTFDQVVKQVAGSTTPPFVSPTLAVTGGELALAFIASDGSGSSETHFTSNNMELLAATVKQGFYCSGAAAGQKVPVSYTMQASFNSDITPPGNPHVYLVSMKKT